MRDAPRDIKLRRSQGILEVTWHDALIHRYPIRDLRCACACAACVDEHTGVRILDVDSVPTDVGIAGMELVGNYALKFEFSDGHDTGIFSWDRLHNIGTDG